MFVTRQVDRSRAPRTRVPCPRDGGPVSDSASRSNPLWQSLAMRPLAIQPKLAVGQPGDPYEQEANRVADRVMRLAAPQSGEAEHSLSFTSVRAQRKCGECEEEEEKKVQRKELGPNSAPGVAPPIVQETLRATGQPLDSETRAFMEPRMGHDFGEVRVHTNPQAAQSARAIDAVAYTVGKDIVFRETHYAPASNEGRRLLAHELAHVAQQAQARGAATRQTDRNDFAAVSSRHPVQVARQTFPSPAPVPPYSPPTPAPPPMPQQKGPDETKKTESPSPAPEKEKAPAKKRAPVGSNGSFKDNSPTLAVRKWEYVVYQDHVRLGNRKVDESPGGPVIGSWPWMTNNPGDLTGDVNPRKENPNDAASAYRQDKRIWGDPVMRGKTPDSLQPVAGSSGLSANNTAVAGFAARHDLAIFADRERGRRALREWIEKYYGKITLAESVKLHLGPTSSHVAGVDDPEKYPKLLQQYLSDHGYPADYVTKTKGLDVKSEEWKDVIDAFGYAEGFYNRRAVAGQPGKFQYVENKGIVYRCSGRDPIDVDPAYSNLSRVKNMPQDTPPEVKDLLGCE